MGRGAASPIAAFVAAFEKRRQCRIVVLYTHAFAPSSGRFALQSGDEYPVMRIVFAAAVAVVTLFAFSTPGQTRDVGTVINVMLAELGTARPEGCPGQWCACYMDNVLARSGMIPRGSNLARDFVDYGVEAPPATIGSIMVMSSHVGVVVGNCGNGQVQIISGNYSNRVSLGCYSPSRAIAWRAPIAGI